MTKPVIGFVAGKTAPAGKRMGHAGAIVSGTSGTAQAKIEAMEKAGILVADLPSDVPALVQKALGK
jgi:succinyl-CoA synthetase alpha subunit